MAEPSHAVRIDPEPKPPRHRKVTRAATTNTTLSNWLNHVENQPLKSWKPTEGKIHTPDLAWFPAKYKYRFNYQPKVVSLGPCHFGEDSLKRFEGRKHFMADSLVPNKELEASLRSEIRNNIGNLMDAYSSYEMKTEPPSKWEEMFFFDGCFVLHFIFCISYNRVEDMGLRRSDIDSVHSDLFLAENQLPFELLKILSGNDPKLLYLVDSYIHSHKISNDVDWDGSWEEEPVHLLDRLRTIIVGPRSYTQKAAIWRYTQKAIGRRWRLISPPIAKDIVLRPAKQLTARGIHLKPNRTGFLKDISFGSYSGTLTLPRMIVDDSTMILFTNLAAYEMWSDVGSTITSYIFFLHSLVNHADDIKELESTGVLVNRLASNEAALNLFNVVSEDLRLRVEEDTYRRVKWKIQSFFEHKTRAGIAFWVVEVYRNHFESPLTAMAFFAACLALALAAIQTYFTVFPPSDKK